MLSIWNGLSSCSWNWFAGAMSSGYGRLTEGSQQQVYTIEQPQNTVEFLDFRFSRPLSQVYDLYAAGERWEGTSRLYWSVCIYYALLLLPIWPCCLVSLVQCKYVFSLRVDLPGGNYGDTVAGSRLKSDLVRVTLLVLDLPLTMHSFSTWSELFLDVLPLQPWSSPCWSSTSS